VLKTAQLLAAVLLQNLQKKAAVSDVPMGGMGFMTNQLANQTADNTAAANGIVGNVTVPTQVQVPFGNTGQLAMNPPATTTDSLRQAYSAGAPKKPNPNPYG